MTNEEALEHFRKLAEQDKAQKSQTVDHGSCPSCGRCSHCGRGGYARPYYVPMPYWRTWEPIYYSQPTCTQLGPATITWTSGSTGTLG